MPPRDVMIVPSSAFFIMLLIMPPIWMRGGRRETHALRGKMAVRILFQCGAGSGLTWGCCSPSSARVARWGMKNSIEGIVGLNSQGRCAGGQCSWFSRRCMLSFL